jgi:hypothetical protein
MGRRSKEGISEVEWAEEKENALPIDGINLIG